VTSSGGNSDDRPSSAAMENFLGRVHGVIIAVSEYLPPASVDTASRLAEHGEPAEALVQLAWAIENSNTRVPACTIDAIYELGTGINDPTHLPDDLRRFAS
jgi:hypothetical protein